MKRIRIFTSFSLIFQISIVAALTLIGCSLPQSAKVEPPPGEEFIETPSGLKYKITRDGSGQAVGKGDEVLLHETMSYQNDSLLFDSRKMSHPVKVLVGDNQVIKGIDEALIGMKKGEIKKLIVPPALSKRSGVQTFPHPDSTLVYVIELMEILKPMPNK